MGIWPSGDRIDAILIVECPKMARFLIAAVALLIVFQTQAFAQQKDDVYVPKTKLEAAALQQGVLLVKDYLEVKTKLPAQVTIDALRIYEPGKEQSAVKGLYIQMTTGGEQSHTRTAFIDFDEGQGLSIALGSMVETMNSWAGSVHEYTVVGYTTKGEMMAGFLQKGKKITPFITIGREFPESVLLDFNDMTLLKNAVDNALTLLQG
jgi:hypothetical protein